MLWCRVKYSEAVVPRPLREREGVETGYTTEDGQPDQIEGVHFLIPHLQACVCLIEEKGRERGRKESDQTRPEAGKLLSTSLHAAAQWSKLHVLLDLPGYLQCFALVQP